MGEPKLPPRKLTVVFHGAQEAMDNRLAASSIAQLPGKASLKKRLGAQQGGSESVPTGGHHMPTSTHQHSWLLAFAGSCRKSCCCCSPAVPETSCCSCLLAAAAQTAARLCRQLQHNLLLPAIK
mmetsp:Transcript_14017/g.40657  ORF Transcript_14017/g.40657 Transcript_14017/m.40657 type:complete len:124 (+) Transcript_14017:96-467(+)